MAVATERCPYEAYIVSLINWAYDATDTDELSPHKRRSAVLAKIRKAAAEVYDSELEGSVEDDDARLVLYSVRLVLHRNEGGNNDIVDVSDWAHDIKGLAGIWRAVADYASDGLHPDVPAPPPELTALQLQDHSKTARVTMSRKANGVASIRVAYQVRPMRKRGLTRPPTPGKPESWLLRIDVGRTADAKKLEEAERTSRSPLATWNHSDA